MLSKKQKVERSLFLFLKKAKFFQSKNISLKVYYNNNTNNKTKFSFIVSKKVLNKANKRNLLKRRGYFIVNGIKNIQKGVVCVFYFKKNINTLSYKEIKEEILNLLREAKLIA